MILADIASLIRSKNAGPFTLTFDIMFRDLASYRRVKDSGALNPATFARLYRCPVEKASRSLMNVVFRVAGGDQAVEREFAKGAAAANLVGTPGHRSVGGMRISLYNAVGLDAVEALVAYMREFERTRG